MNSLSYKEMQDICEKHGFGFIPDSKMCGENNGMALSGVVSIGHFEDMEIQEIVFWHELGHLVNNKRNRHRFFLNKISEEGSAWETGLSLAAKHKRKFSEKSYRWARNKLRSYSYDLDNWGEM